MNVKAVSPPIERCCLIEQHYYGSTPAVVLNHGDMIFEDSHHIGKPNQGLLNKASPALA